MPILPTSQGQDGRGAKQPIDAGQLGTRDDRKITPNREGLLMKKTNAELVDDIRRSGQAIDDIWEWAFCPSGTVNLGGLEKVESHANALHIFCKLLRQRLQAQQPTLTEGE
jgi:hypothetical protein